MKIYPLRLNLLAVLFLVAQDGMSATIAYPPSGGGFLHLSANQPDPALNNVWTGMSQSFTAQDTAVSFGFYVAEQNQIATTIQITLYGGEGLFTSPLIQKTATFSSGTPESPTLVTVDFSTIALSVNSLYTVAVNSLGGGLPAAGTFSNTYVLLSGSNPTGNANPYTAGKFFYTGSSYDPSNFFDRDLAFRVTPVREPESFLLFSTGFIFLLTGRKWLRGSNLAGRFQAIRNLNRT